MSRDFYLSTFEALKKSPYFDERKMLLTGKKACYVLDTVDETYLMFSRHYNENIQKVASWKISRMRFLNSLLTLLKKR